jgi:hypothetical protein
VIDALEGAEGHILLIGRAARGAPELVAGEPDQPLEAIIGVSSFFNKKELTPTIPHQQPP